MLNLSIILIFHNNFSIGIMTTSTDWTESETNSSQLKSSYLKKEIWNINLIDTKCIKKLAKQYQVQQEVGKASLTKWSFMVTSTCIRKSVKNESLIRVLTATKTIFSSLWVLPYWPFCSTKLTWSLNDVYCL